MHASPLDAQFLLQFLPATERAHDAKLLAVSACVSCACMMTLSTRATKAGKYALHLLGLLCIRLSPRKRQIYDTICTDMPVPCALHTKHQSRDCLGGPHVSTSFHHALQHPPRCPLHVQYTCQQRKHRHCHRVGPSDIFLRLCCGCGTANSALHLTAMSFCWQDGRLRIGRLTQHVDRSRLIAHKPFERSALHQAPFPEMFLIDAKGSTMQLTRASSAEGRKGSHQQSTLLPSYWIWLCSASTLCQVIPTVILMLHRQTC